MEKAEFLRLGQIHRNTYINAPRVLNADLSFRDATRVFVAGQLSGVEGYVECIATGLVAALALAARAWCGEIADFVIPSTEIETTRERGAATGTATAAGTGLEAARSWERSGAARPYAPPPRTTALGSLINYITHASSANYQPANISFDLLPPINGLPREIARDRRARRAKQCDRALADLTGWLETIVPAASAVRNLPLVSTV